MYLKKCIIPSSQGKEQSIFKLDIRYTDYFPEYAQYFGRALRLLNSMYGMNNSGCRKVIVHATTEKITMTIRYMHIWHECLVMTNAKV